MTKLQKLMKKLETAIATEDKAYDAAFEGDDFNETAAAEWEILSDVTVKVREEVAAEIVKMTLGQIDEPTAYKMTFMPKFHELVARMA